MPLASSPAPLQKPAPSQLIDKNGSVALGLFDRPVADINHRDYDCRTVMNRPASRLARWAGYNRFQYFGIVSDDLIAGCAFADTRWVGLIFVYLFEPKTGKMIEKTFRRPLAAGLKLCDSPVSGSSHFRAGKNRIDMGYDAASGRKSLAMKIASKHGDIEMDLWFNEADYQPLSICTRAARTGWVYAQKAAGAAAYGTIKGPTGNFDLEKIRACAHHDFSAGYMRRETWWNWACLSGYLADGSTVGLNISCGVNETSFSENGLWVNGQLESLGLAAFQFQRGNADSEWTISTNDGRLELHFKPLGAHCEKIYAVFLASDFSQFFGHFNGRIIRSNGDVIEIKNQLGFVEDQFARW